MQYEFKQLALFKVIFTLVELEVVPASQTILFVCPVYHTSPAEGDDTLAFGGCMTMAVVALGKIPNNIALKTVKIRNFFI